MPINYSKYPANWFTEIRPAVLARADNCCEDCKVKNYELIYRGKWNGIPCYQDMNGNVFSAIDGHRLGATYVGNIRNCNKGTKIILTIAHLIYDEDKTKHCELHELKALCQRCHLILDLPHHISKRKANKLKKQPELPL